MSSTRKNPNPNEESANKCGVCRFVSQDWRLWHFQSSSDPNKYHTVDLAEFDCSGACSCEHFDMRIRPLLERRVIRPHESRAKCKHIAKAEKILCYRVKKRLFEQTQTPNPKRK